MEPEVRRAYETAVRTYREGDVAEARRLLEALVEVAPACVDARNFLGWLLVTHFGEVERSEGIEHLRKAMELRPNHPKASHNLGDALLREGHVEEAASWFQESIRILGGDAPLSYLGLALCREAQGALRQALLLRRQALRRDSNPDRRTVMAMEVARLQARMRQEGIYFLSEREERRMLLELGVTADAPMDLASVDRPQFGDEARMEARLRQLLSFVRQELERAPEVFADSVYA